VSGGLQTHLPLYIDLGDCLRVCVQTAKSGEKKNYLFLSGGASCLGREKMKCLGRDESWENACFRLSSAGIDAIVDSPRSARFELAQPQKSQILFFIGQSKRQKGARKAIIWLYPQ